MLILLTAKSVICYYTSQYAAAIVIKLSCLTVCSYPGCSIQCLYNNIKLFKNANDIIDINIVEDPTYKVVVENI